MGAECSCIAQPQANRATDIIPMSKPRLLINNTAISRNLNLTAIPLGKTNGDYEIHPDEESPDLPKSKQDQPIVKMWSRLKTTDGDPISQREESQDLLKKATTSFFRFSSLESRYQANPIEHANDLHGDAWKLQNIKLESVIHMSEGKFLWEASNIVTEKKCTVKITLVENSRLVHTNFSKTETLLKELSGVQNPNVINIYSFSIFESEFRGKPYLAIVIVQELVKCSLRDVQTLKVGKETIWTQNQLLFIIRDIFAGLIACKERHVSHGKLTLENMLVSDDAEKILIADFDTKLPSVRHNRTVSSTSSRYSAGPFLRAEDAGKIVNVPDEKDIHDLTVMILKLITNDESVGFSYEYLRKDESYRRSYHKVFEGLDMIANRNRAPLQILNDLMHLIGKKNDKLDLGLPENFNNKCKQESHVDLLFLKIDCYELLNQHSTALEVYSELIRVLNNKDRKGAKEYQEYVKCVNRTIKHYLSMNDWLKAKDVCAELGNLLKKDQALKKTLKAHPKEYINFIFLLGNISEGLSEPDKAIELYKKGLLHCESQHLELEAYSSTLKRISNLYMQKKEYAQASEYLKKLLDYYETQEGYFVDRADGYLNMGDILTEQGNLGQAVKFYLKSLENLKKGKINSNEALSNVLDKIVRNYKDLHEYENALGYMLDSLDHKRSMYGKDSDQYLEEIREIAEVQVRIGNYQAALNYYLIYQRVTINDDTKKDKYIESLIYVGDTCSELKDYEKARKFFEKYAEMQKATKGIESKEYLLAQDKLASTFFKEGKIAESLEIQVNAFAVKEQMFPADNFYIIVSLNNIADTYFADGQYTRALASHSECLDRLENRKDGLKEECGQLLLKIALDYDKCGNSGQALKSVHESFQFNKKEGMEPDMENTIKMYELLSKVRENKRKSLDFSCLKRHFE